MQSPESCIHTVLLNLLTAIYIFEKAVKIIKLWDFGYSQKVRSTFFLCLTKWHTVALPFVSSYIISNMFGSIWASLLQGHITGHVKTYLTLSSKDIPLKNC